MPALKLLFRRTLATSAMNPPSILSSPSLHTNISSRNPCVVRKGGKSRLAKELGRGAGLRACGAHINTQNIRMSLFTNNNNNTNKNIIISSIRKKLYMLSSQQHDSSSSSSCSSSPVADMGHDDNKPNGAVDKDERKGNEENCTKLLTLPTVLTLARVAAVPVFISTFHIDSWWGTATTTSIFVAAAVTDWLDGYLARKMRQGTAFGAFLDPVADKLMVAATLVLLCSRPPETALLGDLPWLFPVPAIAIIGREITMSAVREWAASQNTRLLQAVAVNNLGKWKTATQMIALTILVATRDSSLGGSGALITSGVALLYVSAGLAVWSLLVYMRKIWKVLLR